MPIIRIKLMIKFKKKEESYEFYWHYHPPLFIGDKNGNVYLRNALLCLERISLITLKILQMRFLPPLPNRRQCVSL